MTNTLLQYPVLSALSVLFVQCVCVCAYSCTVLYICCCALSIMASPVWTFGISPASSLTVREVKGRNGMLLCIFSSTMKNFSLGCLGSIQMLRINTDVFVIYRQYKRGCVSEVFFFMTI